MVEEKKKKYILKKIGTQPQSTSFSALTTITSRPNISPILSSLVSKPVNQQPIGAALLNSVKG